LQHGYFLIIYKVENMMESTIITAHVSCILSYTVMIATLRYLNIGGLFFSQKQVVLCPTDRLVLTCTSSNAAFLQWKFSNPQQTISSVTRTVSNEGKPPTLTFGGTTFHFSLTSTPGILPHTSQISADNVANGTVVSCSEWVNQRGINTQRATTCIIGNNCG
jgi:hypothetical protein